MAITKGKWWSSGWSSVVGAAVMAQPDPKQNTLMIAQVRSSAEDASLMAAAPRMLAALKLVAEAYRGFPGEKTHREIEAEIKAAIADAEGET